MKKVIIIGAGIAGMSAGIYARMAGFDAEIVEMHSIPGGELTGWDRNGYHIDGCIHWMVGTKDDGGTFNKVFHDIGALGAGVKIIKPDSFGTVELNGQTLSFYRDIERLKKEMLDLSDEDSVSINRFIEDVKSFTVSAPPLNAIDLLSLAELMKAGKKSMPLLRAMKKFKIPSNMYANRFKHPLIRFALEDFDNVVISNFLFSYAVFVSGNADIPEGGSRAMAERIAAKFKKLGGQLRLNSKVQRIILADDKAVGVQLQNGEQITGDYIVPSCDIHTTFKLLQNQYTDKKMELRDNNPSVYPLWASVLFAFAVDGNMGGLHKEFKFKTKLEFEGRIIDKIAYKTYDYEPSFAPEGRNILQVSIPTSNCDYWRNLYKNKDEYNKEKTAHGKRVMKCIVQKIPELSGKLSLIDVATPMTYIRYCDAYNGSWMSWGETMTAKGLIHNGKIKKVKNLYMAGQWLIPPGGLSCSALTGRWAIQRIMKKEKKNFKLI